MAFVRTVPSLHVIVTRANGSLCTYGAEACNAHLRWPTGSSCSPSGRLRCRQVQIFGFVDTALDACFGAARIDTIVACGATTDVCVDTTVRDAFMRDYSVVLLSIARRVDACAS